MDSAGICEMPKCDGLDIGKYKINNLEFGNNVAAVQFNIPNHAFH